MFSIKLVKNVSLILWVLWEKKLYDEFTFLSTVNSNYIFQSILLSVQISRIYLTGRWHYIIMIVFINKGNKNKNAFEIVHVS